MTRNVTRRRYMKTHRWFFNVYRLEKDWIRVRIYDRKSSLRPRISFETQLLHIRDQVQVVECLATGFRVLLSDALKTHDWTYFDHELRAMGAGRLVDLLEESDRVCTMRMLQPTVKPFPWS